MSERVTAPNLPTPSLISRAEALEVDLVQEGLASPVVITTVTVDAAQAEKIVEEMEAAEVARSMAITSVTIEVEMNVTTRANMVSKHRINPLVTSA